MRVSVKSVSVRTAIVLSFCTLSAAAQADAPQFAIAVRAGTPGIGGDLDVSLVQRWLNARIGYSAFDYSRDVTSSDATYHGKLKLAMGTGLLDWFLFGGGFHLTAGVVANSTKVDVTGVPSAGGTITLNGTQYQSSQIGSVNGQMKFGHSTAPYVGLGWGNPAGGGRWHFLFDVGAIYGGTPKVTLAAQCASGLSPAQCTQLQSQAQSDVLAEQQKLADSSSLIKWYPVVNLGVAVHF